jgi:hypothetical protein
VSQQILTSDFPTAERAARPRHSQSKIGALRDTLVALLQEHERDWGIPTNARFLFYELVQRGELRKERNGARRPDQDLHDALTDLREQGRIPWDWIVDETRALDSYTGYASVRQGVIDQLRWITLDPWRGRAPLVLTESRSLAGVLRPVAHEYRARIAATNGQCGGFLRTGIAPCLDVGSRVVYLGDLDLAGDQIEANTRRVLEQASGVELDWVRLALTQAQVRRYKLPVIVKHDRRFKNGGAHEAVETEAIRQCVLLDLLRAHLDELLPLPLARVQEREARQRRAVRKLMKGD